MAADGIKVTEGTDKTVDTESVATGHLQRVKLVIGARDVDSGDVESGNPLPINAATLPLPTGAAADATLGSLTETAPATDTASSGLNGRLQRIAQRITSFISLLPVSLGQKTMAGSLAVTVASDQSTFNVALTPSSNVIGTVKLADPTTANIANVSVAGGVHVNLAQVAAATVVTGAGTAAGSIRVELPTDGTGIVGANLKLAGVAVSAGAGVVGTGVQRTTLASDDPAVATLGATSGAAVITDATGTIQQYLRGLIKQWIAGTLVLGTGANVIGAVTQSTSPWVTKQQRAATPTQTSVASSASTVSLLASNANRLGATFFNDSTQVLYLKLGATASTTSYTVQIASNGYYEVPFNYTGAIDGIWASANGNARITELAA